MTHAQAVAAIETALEGIGEIKIGYHADLRYTGHSEAKSGHYIEIREAYASPLRLYARSREGLVARAIEYVKNL